MFYFDLCSKIAFNNRGEQDAIKDYFQLLEEAQKLGLDDLCKDIVEIISDEMNHTEMLSKWETKLSGIKPNIT